MSNKLHIKNMVCHRCIMAVEEVLQQQGVAVDAVELGHAYYSGMLSTEQLKNIEEALGQKGFELLMDRNQQIIAGVKAAIVKYVHHSQHLPENLNISALLSQELHMDYKQLSTIFSSNQPYTIEKFVILQKTERVKELLSYKELNLSEIAAKMGYSSVHYLSSQFKKVTGITPGTYSKMSVKERQALDQIQ